MPVGAACPARWRVGRHAAWSTRAPTPTQPATYVLCTRDQALPLQWEFPGGKIEAGESPATALARELREELGVTVEVGRVWDVLFHAYPAYDVLMLVYEANDGRREIFLDGRALPAGDVQPWWYGYSVGRWERDTLVVESLGFKDQSWLDEYGTPGSDQLKVTERFQRPNFGTLVVDIAVTDAKAFSRPFSFTLQQRLMPETELIEFVCAENNRPAAHLVGK